MTRFKKNDPSSMRKKAPILAFSAPFMEQKSGTDHLILVTSRESVAPGVWHKQSHEVIMAVSEAGWCPKGCGSPKEVGEKIKDLRYFQHSSQHKGKISKLLCCCYLHEHCHRREGMVLWNTQLQRSSCAMRRW